MMTGSVLMIIRSSAQASRFIVKRTREPGKMRRVWIPNWETVSGTVYVYAYDPDPNNDPTKLVLLDQILWQWRVANFRQSWKFYDGHYTPRRRGNRRAWNCWFNIYVNPNAWKPRLFGKLREFSIISMAYQYDKLVGVVTNLPMNSMTRHIYTVYQTITNFHVLWRWRISMFSAKRTIWRIHHTFHVLPDTDVQDRMSIRTINTRISKFTVYIHNRSSQCLGQG